MSTLSKRKSSILDEEYQPIFEDAQEYALDEENYNSTAQEQTQEEDN